MAFLRRLRSCAASAVGRGLSFAKTRPASTSYFVLVPVFPVFPVLPA